MTGQPNWYGWSAALQRFDSLAADWGVDSANLLRHFGVEQSAMQPPGYPVPTTAIFGLMAALGDCADVESVALHLLRRQTFGILGSMGDAARKTQNLGEALNQIVANLHVRGTGYVSVLELAGEAAIIRYRSMLAAGSLQDVQMDYNVGTAVLGIRGLIGNDWCPEAVYLTRARPRRAADWSDYFGCPIRFDAEECLILFDRADLIRPLAESASGIGTDTVLEGSVPIDFAQLVDREIIRELSTGKAELPAVARALGMNVRMVQRRLATEGTSYQQRLDDVRRAWAQHYLQHGQMPLTALAYMLGYDDLSTFSRTFKSWFGVSPRAWRKAKWIDG